MITLVLASGCLASAESLTGFSPDSASKQIEIETRLKDSISPQRVEENLQWLTSRPHRAGTEGARLTAEHLLQQLQSYGLQAEIVRYDGFLPAPVSVSIELTAPVQEAIPTTEDHIEGDPYTDSVNEHPGWDGYSPSGEATGKVVYGSYGSEEDFQKLQSMGVDLKGKVVLLRYFGTGEGRKVRNAERAGAAAVILYADPADDGFRYGDVYPKGDWRPPGSIMRRSILFLPSEGDPLSPGWASTPGAKRLKPEDVALPRIPVLPISYRSAERLLSLLGGPVAPYEMQGALGLTYKMGPGPAEVHLRTEMDNRDRPMLDVVAKIPGTESPDQWVILSNHHDAWIYGGGDPSSGTAALLALAESLGKMAKDGIRPKRTLIIAFWDAEEMILGGSTEWVEDHQKELLEKAVACINMDSAVFNTDRPLSVISTPVLHSLFREVSHDIKDPRSGRPLFDVWRDLQNQYRKVPGVDGWGEFFDPEKTLTEPYLFETPWDDATPFFEFLALPSSDMYYGADYGMYHSIYENFHWMKTVVDPTFEYNKEMAVLQGMVSLRLANADFLPLDYATEATYWRRAYQDLARIAKAKNQSVQGMADALKLIDQWESEAAALSREEQALLKNPSRSKAVERNLQKLNQGILQLSRDFYRAGGRPGAPNERNLFSGSSYEFENVSGSTLPGIRFNLDQGRYADMDSESRVYLDALRRRVHSLQALRKQLQHIH